MRCSGIDRVALFTATSAKRVALPGACDRELEGDGHSDTSPVSQLDVPDMEILFLNIQKCQASGSGIE